MFDRFGRSRRTRATEKLLADATPPTASVCMLTSPMLTESETLPETRAPPRIGISRPPGPMPIRRLKNSSVRARRSLAACRPLLTVNAPAFSRKNGPFLWEEQAEPIQGDLLLVDLHLREISSGS